MVCLRWSSIHYLWYYRKKTKHDYIVAPPNIATELCNLILALSNDTQAQGSKGLVPQYRNDCSTYLLPRSWVIAPTAKFSNGCSSFGATKPTQLISPFFVSCFSSNCQQISTWSLFLHPKVRAWKIWHSFGSGHTHDSCRTHITNSIWGWAKVMHMF